MNFMLENTIGKVFTAGSTLDDLTREMNALAEKKVYSVADLSIEDVGNAPKEVSPFLCGDRFLRGRVPTQNL